MKYPQHPGFPGMHPKWLWAQPVREKEVIN